MKKQKYTKEDYKQIIQSYFSVPVEITEPDIVGEVHPIFIVSLQGKKEIFRFSDKKCAFHNFNASRILRSHNIPVPNLTIYKFDGLYCECYPFIEGKTLEERRQEGITKEQMDEIYKQIVDLTLRMAKIPGKLLEDEEYGLSNTHVLYKLMNWERDKIFHSDIHSKNVLLDENDKIVALLDLDSIHKAPLSLIMTKLFDLASEYGYSLEDVKRFCPQAYGEDKFLNIEKQKKLHKFLVKIKRKFVKPPKPENQH